VNVVAAPGVTDGPPFPVGFDESPPGERYFRHPGDVLDVVLSAAALLVLIAFIHVSTGTSAGVRADLAHAATSVPRAARELLLAVVQVATLLVPVAVVAGLVVKGRWRRLTIVVGAALTAAGTLAALDAALDLSSSVPGSLAAHGWVVSTRFPSLVYIAALVAAGTAGKPWLTPRWRRAVDRGLLALVVVLAVAGTAGIPELLVSVATGALIGSLVLVAVGAPNRRAAPATVAAALSRAGLDVTTLSLERAEGGRSQLYRARTGDGERQFVKVYGRDSRDADLLYRWYRTLLLRDSADDHPSTLEDEVEHEALLLMLAHRSGAACPDLRGLTKLADGSVVLAMDDVGGRPLDQIDPDSIDDGLLDAVWHEVVLLHRSGLAHRSLRAANVLVPSSGPVIIDLGFGQTSSTPRLLSIDYAELLASLTALVGVERAVASADRALESSQLAAAMPYLQPLALSAATRRQVSKAELGSVRAAIAEATGEEPRPLERLVRVRAKTLVTIALLTGAFYVLLPQLAHVNDSFRALGSANWAWLVAVVAMSAFTYVFSAIGLSGGVRERLPMGPTVQAGLASSFVNRVTPANVGGMALNVRYMQKAGVGPAEAVTGMGLNVLAGGVVHAVLLVVFFAWAKQSGASAFQVPSSSKLLVALVVVLAVVGVALATRRGRRLIRTRVVHVVKTSLGSIVELGRSPGRLLALVGGSLGVTLAYTAALSCSVAAVGGGASFAQVGAVYLGSSVLAAAAPTPGGLGALEAALVAGFTGIGMDPGVAVAAVLSYRLATYWLPVLPGWLAFRRLDRRGYI
jgi:undecaprenyl-diphosphatase